MSIFKRWKLRKQARHNSKVDQAVLASLREGAVWHSTALAAALALPTEEVVNSLWRLEFHGEVHSAQGQGDHAVRFYWHAACFESFRTQGAQDESDARSSNHRAA